MCEALLPQEAKQDLNEHTGLKSPQKPFLKKKLIWNNWLKTAEKSAGSFAFGWEREGEES